MQQKIRDFFNKDENWKYWFTSSRILKEVGGSQIAVSRALGKLSRQGYLFKEMCKFNNKNRPIPIYTLDMIKGYLERLEDENLEQTINLFRATKKEMEDALNSGLDFEDY